jgi:hypothetical protein
VTLTPGTQSKLSHRARSERGDERKPTIDDYADVRRRLRERGDDTLEMIAHAAHGQRFAGGEQRHVLGPDGDAHAVAR